MNASFKTSIPFIILFCLLLFLAREIFFATPTILPSALIGEEVPTFNLPSLFDKNSTFSSSDLKGRVSLLNVWATWCYACQKEHDMLMQISKQYHVPIYGINYKDDEEDAKNWLTQHGNPYVINGVDTHGDVAIDLGIYGTPETFIINPKGKIIYRHIGVIDQKTWDDVLYPIIVKYQNHVE